jgi:glycogen synthase
MTTDTVGGVWNYALELCRGLSHHGVAVMLATLGPLPRPAQRADAALIPNVTLRESEFRLEWMDHPWDDLGRAGEWLIGLSKEFSADLIHLNGYAHAALPWDRPVLVVAHSCVLSWWRAVRGEEAPATWDEYRTRARAGLNAAGLVVAPTQAMLQTLISNYGDVGATRVIPNGCDPARFSCLNKEPFILSVGRLWDEAKNVSALAKAAPRLRWPIRVAGEAAAPDHAPRVWPNVEMLGRREPRPLAALFGHASIYALPAKYEPFGLSILEAALSGCALVLGDIASLRELWNDAALFVPPDDPHALEVALSHLIASPAHRQAMASRALERGGTFTAQRMTASYLDAYANLLASSTKDPSPASPSSSHVFA